MLTKRQLAEELRHAENEIQRLQAEIKVKNFAVERQRDKAMLASLGLAEEKVISGVWRERALRAEKSLNEARALAQSNASRVDTARQLVHEARQLIRSSIGDTL